MKSRMGRSGVGVVTVGDGGVPGRTIRAGHHPAHTETHAAEHVERAAEHRQEVEAVECAVLRRARVERIAVVWSTSRRHVTERHPTLNTNMLLVRHAKIIGWVTGKRLHLD